MAFGRGGRRARYGMSGAKYRKAAPARRKAVGKLVKGTSAAVKTAATVVGIARDVYRLKKIINSEKKHISESLVEPLTISVGQIRTNADAGYFLQDITPSINQGTAASQRTGDSVKLCSLRLRFQLIQMKQLQTASRYKICVWRVKGSPLDITGSPVQVMARLYEPNPMTNCTDYLSNRNPDFFSQFQLLGMKTVKIDIDAFSSQNAQNHGNVIMNLKLNHHVRWDEATQDIANGQIFYSILADTGNVGSTPSSNNAIANTQPDSGAWLNAHSEFYYYDN